MGEIEQAGILPVQGAKTPAVPKNPCAAVAFTVESLKARHPGVVSTLYEQRPHQCQHCGIRFPESSKQELNDHLDWHFRITKEKKKVTAKCRQWYHPVEHWLDLTDARGKDERERSNVFEDVVSEHSKQEQESNVPVLDQKDATCSVCREGLDTFFHDEEEEWMYRNAIRKDNVLYHQTCYEVKTSTGGVSTNKSAVSELGSSITSQPGSGPAMAVSVKKEGDPRPVKKQRI